MILDVEPSLKSPRSPASSPSSPSQASFFQYPQSHVSYSTFTSTNSQRHSHGPSAPVSDVTSLLGHNRGLPLVDDELPPAYDEVHTGQAVKPHRNRFWTRFAAVVLTVFLVCSTWVFYDLYKNANQHSPPTPSIPNQSPPASPPTPSIPYSSPPSSPTRPPPHSPNDDTPSLPDEPYVPPISGRADLCRPWAYSLEDHSDVRLSSFDNRDVDQLVYTVPSSAPIRIETSAICPSKNGGSEFCERYEGASDAISGKLQVIGEDIDKPRIDLSFQHGSERGLEDVSVCLVRRPQDGGKLATGEEDHQWVLGIYIWKNPNLPGSNKVLASLSIKVALPTSRVHDLSTWLSFFTQNVGPSPGSGDASVQFNTLRLSGNVGPTLIQNITAAVVQATSSDSELAVIDSRISQSLDLRSEAGHVACNVTLVHTSEASPVDVNLQSEIGIVAGIFDLEYSELGSAPWFNLNAHSQFSRASLGVTDHQGTRSLRSNTLPPVLPALDVNITSRYASAQLLVPPTFHGSLELSSQYASIVTNDHAKDLVGRKTQWFRRLGGVSKCLVRWAGRDQSRSGNVYAASQLAAIRILFLGLQDDGIQTWPTDGDKTELRQWSMW